MGFASTGCHLIISRLGLGLAARLAPGPAPRPAAAPGSTPGTAAAVGSRVTSLAWLVLD